MQIVCPYNPTLIDQFEGRTLCVRVDHPRDISPAVDVVRRRNRLGLIIATLNAPLAETAIGDDWSGIPIALLAPSCGRMSGVVRIAPELRMLGAAIHLPATPQALTGARVLASLGVPVVIGFGEKPDWEQLADLMTYALLGLVPHAPIEPFATIAAEFKPEGRSGDWGRVEFDDPTRYLHVDADGHIALSQRALAAGTFAGDLSDLDSADLHQAIEAYRDSWRDLFAANHFCTRCRAFRICRGRLAGAKTEPDGCEAFCDDMLDVLTRREHRAKRYAAP